MYFGFVLANVPFIVHSFTMPLASCFRCTHEVQSHFATCIPNLSIQYVAVVWFKTTVSFAPYARNNNARTMGVAPANMHDGSLSVVSCLSWRAKTYWADAKGRLEKYMAKRMFHPKQCLHVVARLYSSLGLGFVSSYSQFVYDRIVTSIFLRQHNRTIELQ